MLTLEQCYELLGIASTTDRSVIAKTYHRMALDCHPDKNSGNVERFQQISAAYRQIMDYLSEGREAVTGQVISIPELLLKNEELKNLLLSRGFDNNILVFFQEFHSNKELFLRFLVQQITLTLSCIREHADFLISFLHIEEIASLASVDEAVAIEMMQDPILSVWLMLSSTINSLLKSSRLVFIKVLGSELLLSYLTDVQVYQSLLSQYAVTDEELKIMPAGNRGQNLFLALQYLAVREDGRLNDESEEARRNIQFIISKVQKIGITKTTYEARHALRGMMDYYPPLRLLVLREPTLFALFRPDELSIFIFVEDDIHLAVNIICALPDPSIYFMELHRLFCTYPSVLHLITQCPAEMMQVWSGKMLYELMFPGFLRGNFVAYLNAMTTHATIAAFREELLSNPQYQQLKPMLTEESQKKLEAFYRLIIFSGHLLNIFPKEMLLEAGSFVGLCETAAPQYDDLHCMFRYPVLAGLIINSGLIERQQYTLNVLLEVLEEVKDNDIINILLAREYVKQRLAQSLNDESDKEKSSSVSCYQRLYKLMLNNMVIAENIVKNEPCLRQFREKDCCELFIRYRRLLAWINHKDSPFFSLFMRYYFSVYNSSAGVFTRCLELDESSRSLALRCAEKAFSRQELLTALEFYLYALMQDGEKLSVELSKRIQNLYRSQYTRLPLPQRYDITWFGYSTQSGLCLDNISDYYAELRGHAVNCYSEETFKKMEDNLIHKTNNDAVTLFFYLMLFMIVDFIRKDEVEKTNICWQGFKTYLQTLFAFDDEQLFFSQINDHLGATFFSDKVHNLFMFLKILYHIEVNIKQLKRLHVGLSGAQRLVEELVGYMKKLSNIIPEEFKFSPYDQVERLCLLVGEIQEKLQSYKTGIFDYLRLMFIEHNEDIHNINLFSGVTYALSAGQREALNDWLDRTYSASSSYSAHATFYSETQFNTRGKVKALQNRETDNSSFLKEIAMLRLEFKKNSSVARSFHDCCEKNGIFFFDYATDFSEFYLELKKQMSTPAITLENAVDAFPVALKQHNFRSFSC